MSRHPIGIALLLTLCGVAAELPSARASAASRSFQMEPSIQFGKLPAPEGTTIWEVALPIDGDVIALETADECLSVRRSPLGDGDWLVFAARRAGPVSGLLRVRDAEGRAHATAVAGEVVPASGFRGLLLRGGAPGAAIERYLRVAGSTIESLSLEGAGLAEAVPSASGWTRLSAGLPAGVSERRGTLRVGEGTFDVQASLLETITVQGSAILAFGFEPRRVRVLDERLQGRRMSARVGVFGRMSGVWWLRLFDAVPDGPTVTFSSAGFHAITPVGNPEDRAHLLRIRHLGGEATSERFLAMLPGGAAVVHPRQGVLTTYEDASLARIGAVRASRVDRNRVFAITGNGDGEWFLRSLLARRRDGVMEIRKTRYTPSLQDLVGASPLLIGDLSTLRYLRASGPRENPLVTVGTEAGDLLLLELVRDGTTIGARRRHAMQVADPRQLPAVQMDVLPSKRAGSSGLPVSVRLAVPGQEVRVLRSGGPGDWSFLAREALGGPLLATGAALGRARFMVAGPSPTGADLLSYAYDGRILRARALGRAGVVPVDYRVSARGRHAWLVGRDVESGLGGIRFVTNGLLPGTNLPPVADAGPDIRTSVPRIYLRANWLDPEGDPIGVRWSGRNVEVADPYAIFTTAQVPRGRSQVLLRAREGGFAARAGAAGTTALQDVDVVRVRYQATTSVGAGVAGLETRLGRPEPNPAIARTFVPFTLAEPAQARVEVFDLHGRRVRTLVDEWLPAGGHDAVWDGLDGAGARATAGVYFVRLHAGAHESRQRIVFVR